MDVSGAVPETEVYDPVANNWRLLDSSYSLGGRPNDPARAWPVGAFAGGDLWVFGGNDFPERRVISSFKRITMPVFQVPFANRMLTFPMVTAGGGANFLEFASPLALNAPATGQFTEADPVLQSLLLRLVSIRPGQHPADQTSRPTATSMCWFMTARNDCVGKVAR